MRPRAHFMTSLLEELAMPARLYGPLADYSHCVGGYDLGSSFSAVGRHLGEAWGRRDELRDGQNAGAS